MHQLCDPASLGVNFPGCKIGIMPTQRMRRFVKQLTYPRVLGSTGNPEFLLPLPRVKTFKNQYMLVLAGFFPIRYFSCIDTNVIKLTDLNVKVDNRQLG